MTSRHALLEAVLLCPYREGHTEAVRDFLQSVHLDRDGGAPWFVFNGGGPHGIPIPAFRIPAKTLPPFVWQERPDSNPAAPGAR
jgi:hypothetical protein